MTHTARTFLEPREDLAVGSRHEGFTVIAIEQIPELSGCAYQLRHDASGARMLWLACDDANRAFAIGFKTPPADDTGVFHILEHSVLCGSERFPVKEPFVTLLKTSMQTFLNAMTFPDKTLYPVASTNVTDLENLMDVYLDAVLHPAIYRRPRIFEQEGWHFELEAPDAPLTYNGVVLNEMKGATSDPDDVLFSEVSRALFPNTAYRFESGGNPRAIPTLTYDEFLDNHARHYNLANSYTILYGDLDLDRELAFIGKRFAQAEQRCAKAPNPLGLQSPVAAPTRRIEMATAPENASVALAYVIGTSAQRERMLAADILLDALCGSNEAPLKRRVLDAGLGEDFSAMLLDQMLQPQIMFTLKGAKAGVAEQFRALVESTCAELAEAGIPADRLRASLAQAEFNLREREFGVADGVAYAMAAMSSWLYDDDDPVSYVRYEQELARMKDGLANGYFEQLLREIVPENAHSALIDLVPVAEGDAAEELAELARIKEGMSADDLQHVIDEVAALRYEQELEDAPEDLAKLPRLSVADIGSAAAEEPVAQEAGALPYLVHDIDTHGIAYVSHYFDLSGLAFDELPYAGLLISLLGKLDTERRSASELDTAVEENLGMLSFFTETYAHDDDASSVRSMLVVSASALYEKLEALAELPREIWATTLFDDTDRMHAILQQRRIGHEQLYLNSGHAAAMARAGTYFSPEALMADQMGGVSFYLFLKDLLAAWDERKDALCEKLAGLIERIFRMDAATISFAGSSEMRARFQELAGTLGLAEGVQGGMQLEMPETVARNEAFITPSNVAFVCETGPASPRDAGSRGSWAVATRALSFDYLWNEVRVKGGAYGTGFRHNADGTMQFWSYRDPNVDGTIGRYEAAPAWLAAWNPSQEELEGYIVSAVAGHDAPVKPRALARRQDGDFFRGRDAAWRDETRSQMIATTADDVHALADALADLAQGSGICVFGSRETVAASGIDFEITELMGSSEA